MRTIRGLLALSGAALATAGCASAAFVSTRAEPIVRPVNFRGKRVAAIVVSADENLRHTVEDALAREISKRGAQGTPSYRTVKGEPPEGEAAARKILEEADIEGAVLMRVVSSVEENRDSPGSDRYRGPRYRSFYRYWEWSWAMAYDPSYLRTDGAVLVETLIYSVTRNELLWAGRSKTTKPADAPKLMRDLVTAAVREMRKAAFIGG